MHRLGHVGSMLEEQNWTVAAKYVDEGASAHTDNIGKRPEFNKMMFDATNKFFDVILVHKLDRFSRNLRVTLECFEQLSGSGTSFISLSENMDFSTPWGRLALTLLGGLGPVLLRQPGVRGEEGEG